MGQTHTFADRLWVPQGDVFVGSNILLGIQTLSANEKVCIQFGQDSVCAL